MDTFWSFSALCPIVEEGFVAQDADHPVPATQPVRVPDVSALAPSSCLPGIAVMAEDTALVLSRQPTDDEMERYDVLSDVVVRFGDAWRMANSRADHPSLVGAVAPPVSDRPRRWYRAAFY